MIHLPKRKKKFTEGVFVCIRRPVTFVVLLRDKSDTIAKHAQHQQININPGLA